MSDLILDFSKDELLFLYASNIQSIGIGLCLCLLAFVFFNSFKEYSLSKRVKEFDKRIKSLEDSVNKGE